MQKLQMEKMTSPITPAGIALLSILLCFVSWAASDDSAAFDGFRRCLPKHSHKSHPISQAIYTPNNSSFDSVLLAYVKNGRFLTPSTPKPLGIVTALHESHVQATVICAKNHGLQLRIRSGGHDYEGFSYVSDVPFVILDMFNLRAIDVDIASETAWVQAGAVLGELYYEIGKASKVHAFAGGIGVGLGAGGHISGGGYGNLLRKYGISTDNVIDAQIVDAQGRILDRKSMGEDLFWAIRGGGGASFGVILSWKIKLVRVPETVTAFRVEITGEKVSADAFYKYLKVASKWTDDLFLRAMIFPLKETGSQPSIRMNFIGFFLGESKELVPLINRKIPELNLTKDDCKEMSWLESVVFWADFPKGTPVEVLANRTNYQAPTSSFKCKSDYVKKVIPKEDIKHIWKVMINTSYVWMQFNPYGGKMSEIPESETAFPHRAGNMYKIQYFTNWKVEGESPEVATNQIAAMRSFFAAMAPYVSSEPREAFLNYRDNDIGSNSPSNQTSFKRGEVYGTKYFKGNFERLTKVKAKVDPDNFFRYEQSIPLATSS